MKKEGKDKKFIKRAYYEGGPKALKKFISKNLRYPAEAQQHHISGSVSVKYTIDHHGQVKDAKVVAGLGHGCDEEALRLVRLLQFQVPKNRGVRVLFNRTIHIHFRPPQAPADPPVQLTYTTVPSPEKMPEKPSGGYTYTIPLD